VRGEQLDPDRQQDICRETRGLRDAFGAQEAADAPPSHQNALSWDREDTSCSDTSTELHGADHIKMPQHKWFKCDDSSVEPVPADEVANAEGWAMETA
jgi:hypothetical protein